MVPRGGAHERAVGDGRRGGHLVHRRSECSAGVRARSSVLPSPMAVRAGRLGPLAHPLHPPTCTPMPQAMPPPSSQVGLPKWWEAGALDYSIDKQTLTIIELAAFVVLEAKRYEGYQKTGAVGGGLVGWTRPQGEGCLTAGPLAVMRPEAGRSPVRPPLGR